MASAVGGCRAWLQPVFGNQCLSFLLVPLSHLRVRQFEGVRSGQSRVLIQKLADESVAPLPPPFYASLIGSEFLVLHDLDQNFYQ